MKKLLKQTLRSALQNCEKHPDNREALTRILPLAKQEYRARAQRQSIPFGGFLVRQIRFLGKRVWFSQALLLLLLCLLVNTGYNIRSGITSLTFVPFLLGCCSVLLLTAAVPMLYRSVRFQMLETEAAARFSVSRLLLARLCIIGSGDLVMLTALLLFAIQKSGLSAGGILLYLLVPFLLTASGYLTILAHMAYRLFPYLGSTLSACLLAGLYYLKKWQPAFYGHTFTPGWGMICLILLLFCMRQVKTISRRDRFMEGQFHLG
ncbi:hypothetical protein C3B58_16405 [Lactonifactor longoviformis]|uniref:ABC-2 family transporter protein n=1 Tax=Lactonifactor longoviformis DSM 17459 TaxID=1122155 RepID=A0A1M4W386_9CLOT|nr:hypothetical protein [Lactonifactor longoviformis]POP31445.1 hypothetical protein C3B58_16405 [Lactonifactor longoviformis]SHE75422.1 hypothetical protein SAMN02745158_01457 [Lactonifactor longoviformis DSM 17459]